VSKQRGREVPASPASAVPAALYGVDKMKMKTRIICRRR
jgi:hypothetical protein